MSESTIKDCIQYFKNRDLIAHEDNGSVYLHVGYDIEVELSTAEVMFRADEYQNEKQ